MIVFESLFFAQLKDSHCKTLSFLGIGEKLEEHYDENPKYTYFKKQYGEMIP